MTAKLLLGRFGEAQDWSRLLAPIQDTARLEAIFEVALYAQDLQAVLAAIAADGDGST